MIATADKNNNSYQSIGRLAIFEAHIWDDWNVLNVCFVYGAQTLSLATKIELSNVRRHVDACKHVFNSR